MACPDAGMMPRRDETAPQEHDPEPCAFCGRDMGRQDVLAILPGARFAHLACARRAWRALTLEDTDCG